MLMLFFACAPRRMLYLKNTIENCHLSKFQWQSPPAMFPEPNWSDPSKLAPVCVSFVAHMRIGWTSGISGHVEDFSKTFPSALVSYE